MATLTDLLPNDRYKPIVCSLEDGPLAPRLSQKGIKVIILPKKRPYDLTFLGKLIYLIRKEKVRLIHSHSLISSIYGWIAAGVTRVPLVITLHGKSLFNLKHGGTLFPRLARRCAKVICVSDSLCKEVEHLGLPSEGLVTIHNGIDIKRFDNLCNNNELRKELRLGSSTPIVGSVGVLRKVKRYDQLLESVPLVLREFPMVKFILVGDGPRKENLQRKSEALGISNSVIFLGQRDDIPRILSIFDIFVISSATEGISIAILEAMALSKPVIATNVGGNPEVVEHGKTGLLIPPEQPRALARAIIELLKDERKREMMGRQGRIRAKQMFFIDAFLQKHLELYGRVLENT